MKCYLIYNIILLTQLLLAVLFTHELVFHTPQGRIKCCFTCRSRSTWIYPANIAYRNN